MTRGLSEAAKKARDYVHKHPGKLNGTQLAKKFGLDPVTVYRSEWWKTRPKAEPQGQS
jgi:hypothetical protein